MLCGRQRGRQVNHENDVDDDGASSNDLVCVGPDLIADPLRVLGLQIGGRRGKGTESSVRHPAPWEAWRFAAPDQSNGTQRVTQSGRMSKKGTTARDGNLPTLLWQGHVR